MNSLHILNVRWIVHYMSLMVFERSSRNLKLTTECHAQLWAVEASACEEEVVAKVVDTEEDVLKSFYMMDVPNLLSTMSKRRRQSVKKVP